MELVTRLRAAAGRASRAASAAAPAPVEPDEAGRRAFVRRVFLELLDREPDDGGMEHFLERFRTGASEADVVLEIADSAEFTTAVLAGRRLHAPGRSDLPDLTAIRPDCYVLMPTPTHRRVLAFGVQQPSDFDWLEEQLVSHDYYEAPGVWSLERDPDKELMAELLSTFGASRSLELGCSTGAVMAGLVERGVDARGVDLSHLAVSRADPAIAPRIVVGDILEADLPSENDLVYGLDIFEHLNPNRLADYLQRVAALVRPGGVLFANIPVFGDDEVFGQVSPFHLVDWERPDADQPFRWLHVDDRGWPLHGHLIWALSTWWVEQVGQAGFSRDPEEERRLHSRFDTRLEGSPARKQFFVFRRLP